jgi:hypothetical protein
MERGQARSSVRRRLFRSDAVAQQHRLQLPQWDVLCIAIAVLDPKAGAWVVLNHRPSKGSVAIKLLQHRRADELRRFHGARHYTLEGVNPVLEKPRL